MSVKLQRAYQMVIYPPQYLQTTPVFSFTAPYTVPNLSGSLELSQVPGDYVFTPSSANVGIITISNPFTIVLNIKRVALSSTANSGNFQIYNLSETTRSQLYRDYSDYLCFRRITVFAGYESTGNLSVVFDGNILWCNSYKKFGTTNYITEIEAFDWGFSMVNAYTNKPFSGTNGIVTKNQVVSQLANDVCAMGPSGQQVKLGYVRNFIDNNGNPITEYYRTISDYSWKQLSAETGGSCFIDSGQLNILQLGNGECFAGTFIQIDQSVGLLGSPQRSTSYVNVEMLFEPAIVLGQQINLVTEEKNFSGSYTVYAINHFGIISDAVGGKLQTNVTLYSPPVNQKLYQLSEQGLN